MVWGDIASLPFTLRTASRGCREMLAVERIGRVLWSGDVADGGWGGDAMTHELRKPVAHSVPAESR